jgi:hypothetical protein
MSNEIQTNETFEGKLKTRIRESIGDLLSDDDLKKIIDRGLEEFLQEHNLERHFSYHPLNA